MKNKKLLTVLAAIMILALGIGVGAYAASNFGTQADPLVAKSYLDKTVTPKLQNEFQLKLDEQVKILEQQISSATGLNFSVVNLTNGQTINGSAGCEIILRSGTVVSNGVTGLTNITSGSIIASGSALTTNNLYVVNSDGDGIKANSSAVILIRGAYTIS